jgi:hypothetical protein
MVVISLKYCIPYIVFLIPLFLLAAVENYYAERERLAGQNYRMIALLSFMIFLFFFGFRGHIGWDWTNYYQSFADLPKLWNLSLKSLAQERFAPGFLIFMSASKSLVNSYSFFLFLSTAIDLILLALFLNKYSDRFALTMIVFLAFMGMFLMVDLIRNSKVILIFLLTIRYIEERKALPFFMINAIGILFHFSAIIFLPLYFFVHRKVSLKLLIIISMAGVAVFLLKFEFIKPVVKYISGLIGGRLEKATLKYFMDEQYSSLYGLTIGFFERLLTAALVFIYYDELTDSKRGIIFTNSFVFFFFIFLFFSEMRIIPIRMGGLFAYSYWYLYPVILGKLKRKGNRQLFVLYIFVYALIKVISISNTILYKYDNILFGAKSFEERIQVFDKVKDILLN